MSGTVPEMNPVKVTKVKKSLTFGQDISLVYFICTELGSWTCICSYLFNLFVKR